MQELDPMKRRLTWTVYATPPMTLTTDLGLSIRVSMFEHFDWWLGPLPRSPGMGEGGDWWSWPMGVIAEGILRGCQGLFTPVSLGYPLSVFNKNSTLKLLFWKQKRTIGSHTNKKILLSHDSPWFFPAFLFFNEVCFAGRVILLAALHSVNVSSHSFHD